MIDKIYIDSAIKIREEVIETHKELSNCEDLTLTLKKSLEEKIRNLEKIKTTLLKTKEEDKDKIENEIINEFSSIEKQITKYSKIIEPLNKKMEELNKREESLYHTIKEKYPSLSDDEIINELKKWIKK